MVDGGKTTQIAFGEQRPPTLKCGACGAGFQDNFCQCDCPERLKVQNVEKAREELYIKAPDTKMRNLWHWAFMTNCINAIVWEKCAANTCEIDATCWAMEHPWEKVSEMHQPV